MELPRGSDRGAVAGWFAASLRDQVMPYWLRTAPDRLQGGYRLMDRPEPARRRWTSARPQKQLPPPRKYLVTQGRMLYGFSLAHRLGLGCGRDDYLRAAELGHRFLAGTMLDREHGGLVSVTEADGSVVDSRKLLCGHAFAIYGLVEYHRASGTESPLHLALQIYRTLQTHLHDREHGGWIEHADRGFRPLRYTLPPTTGVVGVVELKSADAHLHWMEALAELYQATGDRSVGDSLAEAIHFNRTCFFPAAAAVAYPLRTREWHPIGGSRYDLLSYGHVIEFAWLMIRAQQVLGVPPAWNHFHDLVGHVLRWGWDHLRGGLFCFGRGSGPADDRRKLWWVQAEAIAALADGWEERRPGYEEALSGLVNWVLAHHVPSPDGIWITSTDEAGTPLDLTKAGPWKAAYHDVRAMTKYVAAFS
jgi:mannobiose 2-epimerase